ncbi:MAG: tetratricopeptide repeat protein [Planctomycetota bacterium]
MMRTRTSRRLRISFLQRTVDWVSLGGPRRWLPRLPGFDVTLEFLVDWYCSRPRPLLLAAIPALVACGLGMFVGGDAIAVSKQRLIQEYEQRAEQLKQTGDRQGQELCLRALAELDAVNPAHRLRLGQLFSGIGRRDAARQQMRLAAGMPSAGVAEASLWLARDCLNSGVDGEQVQQAEQLLLGALQTSPRDIAVRRELAALLESRGELFLAEHSLREAVAYEPLEYPGLLQWLLRHQRPPERIERVIKEAARTLDERLKKTPEDEALRIALSEVYVVEGNFAAGERILRGVDGARELSQAMRGAWSSLRLLQARSLLQRSPLNSEAVLPLLAESLAYDPWYAEALELAETLIAGGLRFPADLLDEPLQQLRERRGEQPDDWQTASISCRLQLLAGFVPHPPDAPSSARAKGRVYQRQRLQFAELLQRCGRQQEAEAALDQLLSELQRNPDLDPQRQLAAECLLLQHQPQAALQLLRQESVMAVDGAEKESAADSGLLARVSLAAFDECLQHNSAKTPVEAPHADAVQLLGPAFEHPASVLPALERLARLWSGDSDMAAAARKLLCQLRADGRFAAEIPSMLGVVAVAEGRYADAVLFLREADAASGGADAAIGNNLAVALVRADRTHAGEALERIEAALEQQPGHPDLLATQGEVYAALGLWPEAVESLTAALPSRRGDPELQRLLETASQALRDQPGAERSRRPGLPRRLPRQQRQQPGTTGFGSGVPNRL